MRVFITATGAYAVMPATQNIVEAVFTSLIQAVAYVRRHAAQPIYTWED